MREFLETQIAELDREIAELDGQARGIEQRRVIATAKRDAFMSALDHLPTTAGHERKRQGRTGMRSGNWRQVFEFIARNWPNPVTNDQMMGYAMNNGLTLTRQALRAQLSTYTEKGALERVSDGVYRITEAGGQELGFHFMEQTPVTPAVPPPPIAKRIIPGDFFESKAAADSEAAAAFDDSSAERV
jgi:hypothetical protein